MSHSHLKLIRPKCGAFLAAALPTLFGLMGLSAVYASTVHFPESILFATFTFGTPLVAVISLILVVRSKVLGFKNIFFIALWQASWVQLFFAISSVIALWPDFVEEPLLILLQFGMQPIFWVVGTLPITLFCAAIFRFVAIEAHFDGTYD